MERLRAVGSMAGGETHQGPGHAADAAPTRLSAMWLFCTAPVGDNGFKSFRSLSPSDLRAQILLAFPLTLFQFPWLVIFSFGIVKLWKASGSTLHGVGVSSRIPAPMHQAEDLALAQ